MSTLNPAVSNVQGGAQTFEGTRTSISTGTGQVVVPFVAEMYADASGTVGTLQQVSVTMAGIDQIFDVTLANADAVKILNAFAVTDASAGYAESAFADVTVAMKSKSDFVAALASGIADSANGFYTWLKAEARKDTVDILSYDTLVNMLQASDLLTFDISIDASGAADNMYDAMDTGSAAYRKAIFTQIAKSTVEAYLEPGNGTNANDEAVTALGFLPLLKGDKLAFVFDVTVGDYAWDDNAPVVGAVINSVVNDASTSNVSGNLSSGVDQAVGTNASTSNVATGSAYEQGGAQLTFTTPSTRRVAFRVTLGDSGSGAFTVSGALGASAVLTA